jgi:hypothetical protein
MPKAAFKIMPDDAIINIYTAFPYLSKSFSRYTELHENSKVS